jgi:hypothetical protein
MIKYIFFKLPLGLNKHFISVLQTFVGIWDKTEELDQVLGGNRKCKK